MLPGLKQEVDLQHGGVQFKMNCFVAASQAFCSRQVLVSVVQASCHESGHHAECTASEMFAPQVMQSSLHTCIRGSQQMSYV